MALRNLGNMAANWHESMDTRNFSKKRFSSISRVWIKIKMKNDSKTIVSETVKTHVLKMIAFRFDQ